MTLNGRTPANYGEIISIALTKIDPLTQDILTFSQLENWHASRLLESLAYLKTKPKEAEVSSDIICLRIEDIVDLFREANSLEHGKLLDQIVDVAVPDHNRKYGPLLLERVAIASLDNVLRSLVVEHLQFVAQGDFAWLLDIQTIGYSAQEMLELVLESVRGGPWLLDVDSHPKEAFPYIFGPHESADRIACLDTDFHQLNCVHQGGTVNHQLQDLIAKPQKVRKDFGDHEDIRYQVSACCGLAGIIPHWKSGPFRLEELCLTKTIPRYQYICQRIGEETEEYAGS